LGFSPKNELTKFLKEDVGKEDITSKLVINKKIKAKIITRENCVVAGTNFAKQIFSLKGSKTKIIKSDGSYAKTNQTIIEITGLSRSILMCERTALNLLSRMSGISTQTNELVKKIKTTKSKSQLFATRKTVPGLRFFDKEAVQIGGGQKHRMQLDEMVMIKDNHIVVHNSISKLIKKARKKYRKIEVEVDNQKDAIIAAELGASIIMLDNFTAKKIIQTINKLEKLGLRKKVKLEASGRINLNNIQSYAKTGVDMISVGSITSSPKSIDMSLEIS
tara:strand:+ start:2774 stop:3601 length:828 start_codon:yes stop_codon:yes gene_type:complete